jgi:hypothetical protein
MNKTLRTICTIAAGVALTGCDVTNPGPVQQEFLSAASSHEALVTGAGRRLAEGLNSISYTSALISRQIYPGGTTGSLGHSPLEQGGHLVPGGDPGQGSFYNDMIQARFIAESAIDILTTSEDPVDPDVLALGYLYAGFSYRVIAETWCETVFSEEELGGLESSTARLNTAEGFFTTAINTAADPDLRMAGYAGRAQIKVWRGDWAGAAADAGQITDNMWSFSINMDDIDPETRNQLYYANEGVPYFAYSMLFTFYGGNTDGWGDPVIDGILPVSTSESKTGIPSAPSYSLDSGDPRVPVIATGQDYANFAVQGFGQVPYLNQDKYLNGDADIELASGAEMRLIEAEAAIQGGDGPAGLAIIADLRTSYGLSGDINADFPGAAANAVQALMRERGLENWGEGRHWGDQRRWGLDPSGPIGSQNWSADVMATLPDFESTSTLFENPVYPRSVCADVPDSERNSNPNVPASG